MPLFRTAINTRIISLILSNEQLHLDTIHIPVAVVVEIVHDRMHFFFGETKVQRPHELLLKLRCGHLPARESLINRPHKIRSE